MRRGRPRHEDVLTPREWQVLDLLRAGLTNEQIASRLGVSLDTAKFHVSEILSKLGVETRQQAAAWQGRPRGVPGAGLPAAVGRAIGSLSPLRLAGAAVIAAAALGLAALAAGVLLSSSRPGAQEGASPRVNTGDEALDALIDQLLTEDAAQLASRFAGISAREGAILGGPVGIYQPRNVPAAEWTSRLARLSRALVAVNHPVENRDIPVDPPGQPGLLSSRVLFTGQRDYDVVLAAQSESTGRHAWRFSVLDGAVVDVIIDNPELRPGPRIPVPFSRRLAYLIPDPESEAGEFLVLPPEELWLPPAVLRPAGNGPPDPPPAGVTSPAFAPDGRTGNGSLDAIIDLLLTGSTTLLKTTFGDLAAREGICGPNSRPGSCAIEEIRVPPAAWIERLTTGQRVLFSVYTDDPAEAVIVLSKDIGRDKPEQWTFSVVQGNVVQLGIGQTSNSSAPSPAEEYERFFVLPPRHTLPQPPPGHDLSVRTGDAAVDELLSLLQSRDAAGLAERVLTSGLLAVRECSGTEIESPNEAGVSFWAEDLATRALSVTAVAEIPAGYHPPSDHMLVLNLQLAPYDWQPLAVIERNGAVVGWITGDCYSGRMYPPRQYLVEPPPGGRRGLDPYRRSGLDAVDGALEALQDGDRARLETLFDVSSVPCEESPIEFSSTPECEDGQAPGTPVDIVPVVGCHGGYALPGEAAEDLVSPRRSQLALYGVTSLSRTEAAGSRATTSVILASPDGEALGLNFSDQGIVSIRSLCTGGPVDPEALIQGDDPSFLLPPP